jgi:hypothetical protein
MPGAPPGRTIAATSREETVMRVSHIRRDLVLVGLTVAGLVVAAWVAIGYGAAITVAIMTFGLAVVVVPLAAIYFEERDLPRDGRP